MVEWMPWLGEDHGDGDNGDNLTPFVIDMISTYIYIYTAHIYILYNYNIYI